MGRLYLMRHGQTLFNVLRRKQGWCDSPLTELGIEQAKKAGQWFKDNNISFDFAYASSSERACDTLECVAPQMAYERLKGLKEINFGVFEGVSEDLNPAVPYGDFFVQFGGEDLADTTKRVTSTLVDIMKRPGHESVLAVSHGGSLANVLRHYDYDYKQRGGFIGNCAIAIMDFDTQTQSFEVVDLINPNVEQ